jgi:hypothetical protein
MKLRSFIATYYIQWNRVLIKYWHRNSKYPALIKKYKNIHKGKRCFLIGNAPSLRLEDLEKLLNEYTFASNRIYTCFENTVFRPSYYFVGDGGYVSKDSENIKKVPSKATFVGLEDFLSYKKLYKDSQVILYRKVTNLTDMVPFVKPIVDDFVSAGHTVLFEACQFAIYMGFKEIYLLGTDCAYDKNITHFYSSYASEIKGKSEKNIPIEYGYRMALSFGALYKYCEEHGIKMCNTTRGGMLDTVPRVDFDSLF